MKQDFPAGKAVEPRHLQKFRVYAPHAVAQVDHHRRNGGCGHDEYTGPAVKPKPYQSQHNPAYRRHRLEHMDERRPHILQFGAQAEQQTQNGTHRNPDPKAERQAQQGGTDGGPDTGTGDSANAWLSVLQRTNVTSWMPSRYMWFTALPPPPPTPITLMIFGESVGKSNCTISSIII